MGKVQAHTRYKTADGHQVPGVTTVTGILNKPALVPWANRLGLDGIDVSKYVDEKAAVGTLAHYRILCRFRAEEPEFADYTPNQIQASDFAVRSFESWIRENPIDELVLIEQPLVSERHRFGGTLDLYGAIHGRRTLIDLKTGRGIYDEHFYQLAGYLILLEEHGHAVDGGVRIVRIGRDADEGFEVWTVSDLAVQKEIFLHCLAIHRLRKEAKNV